MHQIYKKQITIQSKVLFYILTIRFCTQKTTTNKLTKTMPNNEKKITFRQIEGVWKSDEQTPRTFADFLEYYNLQFDDKCTIARYIIYKNLRSQPNLQIEIRAFSGNIRTFIKEF